MAILGTTHSLEPDQGSRQDHQGAPVGNRGILNAIVLKVSNGPAEGINSQIKTIKVRSRGFRNKKRFANAIYFHLGGLNLYPEGVVK